MNRYIKEILEELKTLDIFKSDIGCLYYYEEIMKDFIEKLQKKGVFNFKKPQGLELKLLQDQKRILIEGLKNSKSEKSKISYKKQLESVDSKIKGQVVDIESLKKETIDNMESFVIIDGIKYTGMKSRYKNANQENKYTICLNMLWEKIKDEN